MNSIALGLENILTNEEEDIDINDLIKKLYITDIRDKVSFIYNGEFKFFEEIRELDLYNAVNRMTGIKFKKIKGGEIIVKNYNWKCCKKFKKRKKYDSRGLGHYFVRFYAISIKMGKRLKLS